jgi:hypothetical protein
LQARGRTLATNQIIEVPYRFNDLKPFVWTGAISPSAYRDAIEEAVVTLREIAPDESDSAVVSGGSGASDGSGAGAGAGAGAQSEAASGSVVTSAVTTAVVSHLLEEVLCATPAVNKVRAKLIPDRELITPIHPVGSLNLDLFLLKCVPNFMAGLPR